PPLSCFYFYFFYVYLSARFVYVVLVSGLAFDFVLCFDLAFVYGSVSGSDLVLVYEFVSGSDFAFYLASDDFLFYLLVLVFYLVLVCQLVFSCLHLLEQMPNLLALCFCL